MTNSLSTATAQEAGMWAVYKAFIASRIMGGRVYETQNIAYWRDHLFSQMITYFLPCCLIALLPCVALSFASGHPYIGAIDVLAFVLILSIILVKKLSLTFRKIAFITVIYSLSAVLLVFLGLFGPGGIYLLSLCVLTTIILPKFWGYISACANLLVCICCGVLISLKLFDMPFQAYSTVAWIAVCSNLVFLSFVVVAVVSRAIEGLENTLINADLLREQNLKVIKNLEYNERRLKQAQSLAHIGSWELSFSTGIALWSAEACRIYGLDAEDNVQSFENWVAFNHPEDNDGVLRIIDEARKSSSNVGVFHRIVRRDGEVRYLYSESHYEFNDEGQPIGMYGIAHDITEVRESQEELRKSNERFELVNQATREAILDWDIVADTTFWGNGFTEIFGYKAADFHNHLLSDNIHPEDRTDALDFLYRTLNDPLENVLYHEFRFLRADRSIAHVQIRTVLIRDCAGKAIRAVSSLMDVTDLVKKNKELKMQNLALKEIAWIQSHEIRSPLACIMGLIDLLDHKDEHSIDESKLINEIQGAAEKLDQVIRKIVRKTEAVESSSGGFVNK